MFVGLIWRMHRALFGVYVYIVLLTHFNVSSNYLHKFQRYSSRALCIHKALFLRMCVCVFEQMWSDKSTSSLSHTHRWMSLLERQGYWALLIDMFWQHYILSHTRTHMCVSFETQSYQWTYQLMCLDYSVFSLSHTHTHLCVFWQMCSDNSTFSLSHTHTCV